MRLMIVECFCADCVPACLPTCQQCDQTSGTCVPVNDGGSCGAGQECSSGQCIAQGKAGLHRGASVPLTTCVCTLSIETMSWPRLGMCFHADCGGSCTAPCQQCHQASGTCHPANEGGSCGFSQVCRSGVCTTQGNYGVDLTVLHPAHSIRFRR